jgi:hypothetical protein
MHEPITCFINDLLSGMRYALPGQPGSAPHLPDNHCLKLILKWIKKFGLNTEVFQIPKINQLQTVRLVNILVKNLNFNKAIHLSSSLQKQTQGSSRSYLAGRIKISNHSATHFSYSRSTLILELR